MEDISVLCEATFSTLNEAMTLVDEPRLLTLFRFWLEKKGERIAPARSDLDPPYELTSLLPFLFLLRRQNSSEKKQPTNFHYSLVGTNSVEILGFDNTGHALNTCRPASVEQAFSGSLLTLSDRPSAHYCKGSASRGENDLLWFKRLLLPLCDETQAVTHFLGAIFYTSTTSLDAPFCECFPDSPTDAWFRGNIS